MRSKVCDLYGPTWYKPWWTVECYLLDRLVMKQRRKTREEADAVVESFLYKSGNTIWLLGKRRKNVAGGN